MIATVAEFKSHFDRDFDYGSDVRDSDIERAFAEADATFNPDIYPVDAARKLAYLYLSAHFLTQDLTAAESGGGATFNAGSRSVGSVSVTSEIPEWMKQGEIAFYSTTYYGQKWLILTKPYLDGVVFTVGGGTSF